MTRFDAYAIGRVFTDQVHLVCLALSTAFRLVLWAVVLGLLMLAWYDWSGLLGMLRLLSHSDQAMVRALLSGVGLLMVIAALCLYAYYLVHVGLTKAGRSHHGLLPPSMRRSDQVSIP